jgi:hypothetical protein
MALFHLPSLIPAVDAKTQKLSVPFVQLFTNLFGLLNQGFPPAINNANGQAMPQSRTIVTAKLTVGGANGSMTFTNGILTAETPAT